jgi:hypothetical protein
MGVSALGSLAKIIFMMQRLKPISNIRKSGQRLAARKILVIILF